MYVFLIGVEECSLVEHHVEELQEEVQDEVQQGELPLDEVDLHPPHKTEVVPPLVQDHQPRLRG